ncbi:MAG: hypothetical protein ACYC7E_20855 [Armatimonadota bacterium]
MAITREQLLHLRELCANSTPGAWKISVNFHGDAWEIKSKHKTFPVCTSMLADRSDLEFIVAAHEYLPILLDEIERLQSEHTNRKE